MVLSGSSFCEALVQRLVFRMLAGSLVDNAFAWDHGVDLAASMLLWWVICLHKHTHAAPCLRLAFAFGALPAASFLMIIHVFLDIDIVSVRMTMPP